MLLSLFALTASSPLWVIDPASTDVISPLYTPTAVAVDLIYDRLYARDPATGALVGRLVASDALIDGGGAIRVVLREDATWHDGRPVTAADVCFTIEARLESPSPVQDRTRYDLAGCQVDGERAATIRLARAVRDPREPLAFAVMPAHAFDGDRVLTRSHAQWRAPLGSGPMRAEQHGGLYWALTAAPASWRPAPIPMVIVRPPGDPFIEARAITNGDALPTVDLWPTFGTCAVASAAPPIRFLWTLDIDPSSAAFADPDVRIALRDGLDRAAWCVDRGPDVSGQVMCTPILSILGELTAAPTPSTAAAAAATPQAQGSTAPDVKIRVSAGWAGPPRARHVGDATRVALGESGFQIDIFTGKFQAGAFDATLRARPLESARGDPALWLPSASPYKLYGGASPELEAAVAAWTAAPDPAAQALAFRAIDRVLFDEARIIPIAIEAVPRCLDPQRIESAPMSTGAPFAFFERWTLR